VRRHDVGGRSLLRPDLDEASLADAVFPAGDDVDLDLSGVRISGGDRTGTSARGEITGSVLESLDLTGTRLRPLVLADARLHDVEVSNAQWHEVTARRVELRSARGVGLGLSLDLAWDVYVEDYRLDYAGIHVGRVRGHLVFRDCSLRSATLAGDLSRVVFDGCDLTDARFEATAADGCDLRSSRLAGARGLHGLRGARIDTGQLVVVAAQLAAEAGIRVVTDADPDGPAG
jgi:uncharacterized protein YjbI with pentapeptide repeats